MMTLSSLTASELKELLTYDETTGVFTWRVSRGSAKAGSAAGYATPNGYIAIQINRVLYKTHRLAWLYMLGTFPLNQIDHINRIKDDNRFVNLRDVTQSENQRNAALRKDNTSRVLGVSWYKPTQKWCARISVNSRHIHLGYFDKKDGAVKARMRANSKYNFHENHGRDTKAAK